MARARARARTAKGVARATRAAKAWAKAKVRAKDSRGLSIRPRDIPAPDCNFPWQLVPPPATPKRQQTRLRSRATSAIKRDIISRNAPSGWRCGRRRPISKRVNRLRGLVLFSIIWKILFLPQVTRVYGAPTSLVMGPTALLHSTLTTFTKHQHCSCNSCNP